MPGQRRNPKHPIDRGAPASVVADRFGGGKKLADAIKRSPSTVHRWIMNGFIPGPDQPDVLAAAKKCKVKLSPTDFVDTRVAPMPASLQAEA